MNIRIRQLIAALLVGPFLLTAGSVLAAPASAGTVVVHGSDEATSDDTNKRRKFVLIDSYGRAVTDQHLRGSFALMFFGYTFCPDVCPTSLQTIAVVLDELGEDAAKVKPLFISVDPKRDTPEVLRDYVSLFDERIIPLTGPRAYIDAAVAAYNLKYEIGEADPSEPENYLIDHSASIAFIGPDGALITRFGYGMTAEYIAKRIREVIAATPLN